MKSKMEMYIKPYKFLLLLIVLFCSTTGWAQDGSQDSTSVQHEVLFETNLGDFKVVLYNETPRHRDNFLELVKKGYYDGILFHRVIGNFMIQTGDSTTRHALPGESVGNHDLDYTIPAEIVYPQYFHKRGALAAAREGDAENPERASSAAQFYIAYGTNYSDLSLDRYQEQIDQKTKGTIKFTKEIRDYYRKYGGTPHLDGQYTVFGEVSEGLDVVRKINFVRTDDYNRPIDDVRIIKASVIR